MPRTYSPEAVEKCCRLYLLFNGQNHDLIEQEMRKEFFGWSKQNLYSRGDKLGWIDKYGWEKALKLHLAKRPEQSLTSAEAIFRETEGIRQSLFEQIKTQGPSAERDLVYQHRDYCKLSIDALSRLEAARDNLAGFVASWEKLLDWLPEISETALRELLKVSDQVIEKAQAEYAEAKG